MLFMSWMGKCGLKVGKGRYGSVWVGTSQYRSVRVGADKYGSVRVGRSKQFHLVHNKTTL